MRVFGIRLFKPIMACCASKKRIFLSLFGLTAVGVAAWALWPRTDAAPSVALPSDKPVVVAKEQTSAEALSEGLTLVQQAYDSFDQRIKDYTATFEKQERVDGVLLPKETLLLKLRQEPFSVYLQHQAPADKKGQEAIYVEGQNDGNLVAHDANPFIGLVTLRLPPQGYLAMRGNRYDITTAGMKNLLGQLLKLASEQHDALARCQIRFIEGELVGNRVCRCLEIKSSERLPGFPMAQARIYFDEGYGAPVRYEAFEWPATGEGAPELVEFYQYTNVQLNVKLQDSDFDPANPAYGYNE